MLRKWDLNKHVYIDSIMWLQNKICLHSTCICEQIEIQIPLKNL